MECQLYLRNLNSLCYPTFYVLTCLLLIIRIHFQYYFCTRVLMERAYEWQYKDDLSHRQEIRCSGPVANYGINIVLNFSAESRAFR